MKSFYQQIFNNWCSFDIISFPCYEKSAETCGVKICLQRFADEGEKTEKATPKKRREAREKGQVLQSRELSSALVLLIIFISIKLLGGYVYKELIAFFRYSCKEYMLINDMTAVNEIMRVVRSSFLVLLKTIGPFLAVALGAGFIASYAQVGTVFTIEPLTPKFNKLSPMNGLKRIFSIKGLVQLLKSLLKVVIVGGIAYSSLKAETGNIVKLMDMDVIAIGGYIGKTALDIAIKICAVMIVLAIFDYGYQWWQYEKDLKMTKQEIKEEYKQTEGNPETKSRIKQKQKEISMRRMMEEVPKADVVITNPTHYAVAVKYDEKVSSAPLVTAKGQDFLAIRIKEIAKDNSVEIVENKPLAQTLYKTVDIGQEIPPELYQAVAEVLAFVYSLR